MGDFYYFLTILNPAPLPLSGSLLGALISMHTLSSARSVPQAFRMDQFYSFKKMGA
jgi:hypothetical protein